MEEDTIQGLSKGQDFGAQSIETLSSEVAYQQGALLYVSKEEVDKALCYGPIDFKSGVLLFKRWSPEAALLPPEALCGERWV